MATYAGTLPFAYTGGLSGPSCTVGQQRSTILLAPAASMVPVVAVCNMGLPVAVCGFALAGPARVPVPTAEAVDELAPGIGALSVAAPLV